MPSIFPPTAEVLCQVTSGSNFTKVVSHNETSVVGEPTFRGGDLWQFYELLSTLIVTTPTGACEKPGSIEIEAKRFKAKLKAKWVWKLIDPPTSINIWISGKQEMTIDYELE